VADVAGETSTSDFEDGTGESGAVTLDGHSETSPLAAVCSGMVLTSS